MKITQEEQILDQYIKNHSNPKTEFEKWFVCALEELKKAFSTFNM